MNNLIAILRYCDYCDIAILRLLRYCDIAITSYTIHLTFPFPPPSKKNPPFPLPFRKYIVTLPHTGLRHEEQAILICTILQ